mmetsp:Transcript_11835/g.35381  ORF Transcript_11835/g.35381 Transcript_11835/m.35381 type:complete len:219 (+) Transcript_11835:1127-1783(+)
MRVGSPEDCCRDPPVVTQPPTSSATEESEGAPPLTAGLAAHRPTKHPLEHLYKYKYKGDLLQVVNTPGGSGKTLALATLLAEQEEIRSRSATWQLVAGLGSCDPPLSEDRRERAFVLALNAVAFLGYGFFPVTFFCADPSLKQWVPAWPGADAAQYWGNLAGDAAWTVESALLMWRRRCSCRRRARRGPPRRRRMPRPRPHAAARLAPVPPPRRARFI